jgi:hypothetical protein
VLPAAGLELAGQPDRFSLSGVPPPQLGRVVNVIVTLSTSTRFLIFPAVVILVRICNLSAESLSMGRERIISFG